MDEIMNEVTKGLQKEGNVGDGEELKIPSAEDLVISSPYIEPEISDEEEGGEIKSQINDALGGDITINIDNTPDEVLSFDKEGREIYFSEGSSFLKLPAEVVRGLSDKTRIRYFVAKGTTENSLDLGEKGSGPRDAVISDLRKKFSIPGGTATEKLNVRGGDPGKVYSHFKVARLGYAEQRGWSPVRKGGEALAFTHDTAGSSIVLKDKRGELDMILMEKDRDLHEKEQKEIYLHRRKLRGDMKKRDLAETGQAGFDPEEGRFTSEKMRWKDI